MARTLPWLKASTTNTTTATSSRGASNPTPQRRRVKPQPDTKEDNNDNDDETTPKANPGTPHGRKRDFLRSSPTPPSSPIHRCPSEEYLIPGLQNDDIYMMVEDEFNAIAQSFTQHLHYAEYIRRKKEAKLVNAAAIRDLARPTDGVTPVSEETRQREAGEALSARQREGVEGMGAKRPVVVGEDGEGELGEEEEDDAFAGTSLHGLMVSPRKARSLVGMQGIKSSTRAAAGFSQASEAERGVVGGGHGGGDGGAGDGDETVSEDDDDDLDVQVSTPTTTRQQPRPRPSPKKRLLSSDSKPTSSKSSPLTARSSEDQGKKELQSMGGAKYKPPTALKPRKRMMLFDDFDELPEPVKSDIQAPPQDKFTSSDNQTQQKKPRGSSDLESKKKSRLNEVPTFLL